MTMEFVTYKKYAEPEHAFSLTVVLEANGIEYILSEDRVNLDSLYGDTQFRKQYYVKIRQKDFEKADNILLNHSYEHLNTVEEDHYLFSFTNEELYEILSKPDEWNEFDFLLAMKILKERGENINLEEIKKLKQQRIQELAKPEKSSGWVITGYLFALASGIVNFMSDDFTILLGELFGVVVGFHLYTFKKTLPNGDRVYAFSANDRAHGYRIIIIDVVLLVLWLVLRINNTGF